MKIIFVISAMHGGGAERVIATLANRYANQGDQVTILMAAGEENTYPLEEAVTVRTIGQPSHGNPLVQIKRLWDLRAYFKAHPDSAIVSFGTDINLFTILSCLGLKNKVIVSERNDPNRCAHPGLRNLIYGIGSQRFVFQTEAAMACFSQRIQKKSMVIPNPIRTDLPEPYQGKHQKRIAAVGRLEPQKNHMLLLEAFAGFHKKNPEWQLHLFGKGSLEKSLREQAEALGIAQAVFFEGFCSKVLEKIREYGMYVLSSDYEGISNSLMEAMAIGLPCISTDCPIGGSALCIENGKNGLLVSVGKRQELEDAMSLVAGNAELAERIGRAAGTVRERFSEEKIAGMWYSYIS